MAAEAPEDHFVARSRHLNSVEHGSEGIGCQDVREGIQECGNTASKHRLPYGRGSVGVGFGEIFYSYLAAAGFDWNGGESAQINRMMSVFAHATFPFFNTFSSACAVWLFLKRRICSGVPDATTLPPFSPPSGPMSIMWSADFTTSI